MITLIKVSLDAGFAMTNIINKQGRPLASNKQMLKNKVTHLEQALMEADFRLQDMFLKNTALQAKINDFKESEDLKDLETNNDLILNLIKERLKLGALEYHQDVPILPSDDITRDNFYEAVQEALDLSVYLSAYMLRLMEEKERREGETTTADEHKKEEGNDKAKESAA